MSFVFPDVVNSDTKSQNGPTTTDSVQSSTDQPDGQKTDPSTQPPTDQTHNTGRGVDMGAGGDVPNLAATAGKDTGASLPTDTPVVTGDTTSTTTQPTDSVNNNTGESDAVPSGDDQMNQDTQVLPPGDAVEPTKEVAMMGNKDEEEKLFSEGEDDKKTDDLEIPEVGRTCSLM